MQLLHQKLNDKKNHMKKIRERIETLMILIIIALAIIICISFFVFISNMNQNISVLPLFYILTTIFYIFNFINNSSERNRYTAYRKSNPKDEHLFLHFIFLFISLLYAFISYRLLWV